MRIGCGALHARTLSHIGKDRSNWRMDQCAIHMDVARTMLWQTSCPILPQR
jgi:hypothetical protein